MKRKTLIELFIYVIVVVVGITLLLTSKPKQKPIQINSDFKIEDQRGDKP
jgi:hypothetical protein